MKDLPLDLAAYNYRFDPQQIAYFPLPERTSSRLLLVRKDPPTGLPRFEDLQFSELPALVGSTAILRESLWVRNRSRVLKARLFAQRRSGGRHEIILLERRSEKEWSALIRNVARIRFPEELLLEGSEEKIKVLSPNSVEFLHSNPLELIEVLGRVPLPPYIEREPNVLDQSRYQSVWAAGEAKSSAAPTASLHFSEAIWEKLLERGIRSADVSLHVGRGTFEPLRERDLARAQIHAENFEVEVEDFQKIIGASSVVAIGTTACRLSEELARRSLAGQVSGSKIEGSTDLFIKPGFEFRKVRGLLTNFHLPESSLFILVSVFAGSLSLSKEAYSRALKGGYRLFSYGDASLWI